MGGKLRFKRLHPRAVLPSRAHPTDAGLDLTAVGYEHDASGGVWTYNTGWAVEIPPGHVGLLFPRSSVFKTPLMLANSVGVIDSDYRGEIRVKFREIHRQRAEENLYQPGDRVAQLLVVPICLFDPEEGCLSETERGEGGFGSSGR